MQNTQKSYRQVFASTSLFSSVQLLNIIASAARSKFAAIFIGPVGIGILGALNAVINLISGISKIGLDTSAVKDIAYANKEGDTNKVNGIIFTLKRILWFTGLLGALTTIFLSGFLSDLTFGNANYVFSFFWLSIAVLFNQLTVGNLAVFQGLRRLRELAFSNLIASIASVIIVVPCYYFFQLKGIVPSIILVSLVTFIISAYFSRFTRLKLPKQSYLKTFAKGKAMIKLGAVLSINSLISLVVAYVMQVYITTVGGLTQVGFYNAAIVIVNSYVGIVFNAMSKDYFPRLSETINNKKLIEEKVSQQALIAILFLAPIVIFFIAFAQIIIRLLYSKEFLPIVAFVSLALLGTLFKALSWSKGYVIIAKGDSKVFIKTAIGFNTLLLILNIYGYNFYGLFGLGVSFVVYYIIHYIIISLVLKYRYHITFNKEVIIIFSQSFVLSGVAYLSTFIGNPVLKFLVLIIILLVSIGVSVYHLDKKLNLIALLKNKIKK
ncbi:oligosaccharide flippase family protein [Tamlana sp. 62-3]|uniref:Oligosaccharide flippase family protein n=1 Tax=Neotamlana sargassicola TaxID=2883125 RepID=A0A9X1L561_9FLAO|nr:oligosaccharide flippase family protein [Tamlana sargassicola]MCB4808897.1 oligosaccharide flippase family protein [Tamlana sargassicola]